MRVLKVLLSVIFSLLILVSVTFFVGREILLLVALLKLKGELSDLDRLQKRGEYSATCMNMGSVAVGNEEPYQLQIRFESETAYVVEAVCKGMEHAPILIDQQPLPFLVKKQSGSAGIVWPEEQAGVRLKILGREGEVRVEYQEPKISMKRTEAELSSGPRASCTGYGFYCCNVTEEAGVGDQLQGATDCPDECFASCAFSPVILSFASQPFYDQTTRQVSVRTGEAVLFSYSVSGSQQESFAGQIEESDDSLTRILKNVEKIFDDQANLAAADQIQVIVDFGDGNKETSFELIGNFNHKYACANPQCTYQAQVSAINMTNSSRSADSILSKITIVVSP